jgi:hypothetical protein
MGRHFGRYTNISEPAGTRGLAAQPPCSVLPGAAMEQRAEHREGLASAAVVAAHPRAGRASGAPGRVRTAARVWQRPAEGASKLTAGQLTCYAGKLRAPGATTVGKTARSTPSDVRDAGQILRPLSPVLSRCAHARRTPKIGNCYRRVGGPVLKLRGPPWLMAWLWTHSRLWAVCARACARA